MTPTPDWRADAALVVATFFWGVTFAVVKQALDDSSTFVFLAVRFTLAAALVGALFARRWKPDPRARMSARCGLLAGVCLFVGYGFQTVGLRFTTPTKSAFVTGLTVVVVPFLAAAVYRSVPALPEAMGAILAAAGLALMTLPPGAWVPGYGDLITSGCTVAYAAHVLVIGRFAGRAQFERVAVWQLGVCALLAWLLFPLLETPFWRPSPQWWAAVGITAVFATALGFTIQAWAQQHTTPVRTALIFSSEPLFAWAASYALTGETLSGRGICGAVLILAGILLVELKPIRWFGHPSN